MRVEEGSRMCKVVSFLCVLNLSLLSLLNAQPLDISARSLDALLQGYAFRAFSFFWPRTGISYDAQLPNNLSEIQVSANRFRSGSLRMKGVQSYKEFQIPIGVVEQPYVERLVLVYHNLGNLSSFYYPLPGFTYLAPVLGLLAYNASDLSATDLPELDIRASDKPILIKFPNLKSVPDGLFLPPKCVFFDLHGSVQFDNVLSGNVCSTTQQGHFSIVVESTASSPAPIEEFSLPNGGGGGGNGKWRVAVITLGSLFGGFLLLGLLGLLVLYVRRSKHGKKVQQQTLAADWDETLQMTSIGYTKAPLAMGTRTLPVLENEYVP